MLRSKSSSKPIPIGHSRNVSIGSLSSRTQMKYAVSHNCTGQLLHLLVGMETSKIHGVTLTRKMGLTQMYHLDSEDCEVQSTEEMSITNECNSVSPGDIVYLIFHVKEYMGISQSLGAGTLDTCNKTLKYIGSNEEDALAYVACNKEYASQYDEKLEMVKMVVK